jgi:hypothetical protein
MDQLLQTYTNSPLWFWLLGSVLAYGLATNALWILRSRDWLPAPYTEGLVQIARFLFYLGIPYLALGGWPRQPFQGLLLPGDMGLVGIGGRWPPNRWLEAAGTAIGFGLLACLLLALAWALANRQGRAGMDAPRFRFPRRPWWIIPIDTLYLQVHWAFYRAALAVLLEDLYKGVFLGLGLVYLEWSLNPYWRRGWRAGTQAAAQWLQAALALVTALIFLYTRNAWLCLGVHAVLVLLFWGFGREPAVIIQQETVEALPPMASGSDPLD